MPLICNTGQELSGAQSASKLREQRVNELEGLLQGRDVRTLRVPSRVFALRPEISYYHDLTHMTLINCLRVCVLRLGPSRKGRARTAAATRSTYEG